MSKEVASRRFVLKAAAHLIRYEWKAFIMTFLVSMLFFVTPLGIALIIREIFNILSGEAVFTFDIWTLIWLLPLAYVIQLVTDVLFSIIANKFTLRNQILLRKNMIRGVFQQPGANALEKSPGEAISRFRGDNESIVWFTLLISDISAYFVFAVISFILMVNINSTITYIVFIPFLFVVSLIVLADRVIVRFNDANRKAAGRVTGAVGESFNAIQSIKIASAEKHVINHFQKLNEERRIAAVKDSTLQAMLRSLGRIVVTITTGVILYVAAAEMNQRRFTIGDFTLFIFLLGWLTDFIYYVGEFLAWFQRNRVSFSRILKITQGPSGSPSQDFLLEKGELYVKKTYPEVFPLEGVEEFRNLRTENLSYTYPDTQEGIFNINLNIKRGTLNVIVGRVGSGKSTLLKSILGLLPADGKVFWNEKQVDPSTYLRPPRISYTSQVPSLFSDSVKENILWGLPDEESLLQRATDLAVVREEIMDFEEGYNTKVGPKGVRLSGGQKHRIAAARMFARDPQLYIFDDLSSALDVKTEEQLWDKLFKDTTKTFLVTSHRKFVLNRADTIFVIKEGRLLDVGNLVDLLNRCEEMRHLWQGLDSKPAPAQKRPTAD